MEMNRTTMGCFLACFCAVFLGACDTGPATANISEAGNQAKAAADAGVFLATIGDLKAEMEESRGHVTVVNFWATWCPPCVKEMPELVEFDNEYSEKGVRFLSISADDPSTLNSEVVSYSVKNELNFSVYVMNGVDEGEIQSELGLDFQAVLPTTFVLDKEGKVVKSWIGAITKSDLTRVVDPLLE